MSQPRYRPYPEYKDSGVPWLGKIPAHWDFRRLKYTAPESGEKLGAKPEGLPYIGLENIESGTGRLSLAEPTENVESTVVVFQEGDILFGKLRPYLAKVVLADFNGVGTTELLVLRPQADVDARFLFYQLLSDSFIDTVNSLTYGAKMPRANSDQVGKLSVCIAPRDEQRAIARFLDHYDRITRRYIRAQRRLIKLLEEQKQALIQQAVTRGLDPDVPLKDSGIEWLGEIPKHWEVVALKHLGSKFGSGMTPRGGATVYQSSGIPLIRSQNVRFDGLHLEDVVFISNEIHSSMSSSHVRQDDVLLNITGASIGRVCVVPPELNEANVNQHVSIIRPDSSKISSEFLAAFLSSPFTQSRIFISAEGAAREGLPLSEMKSLPVVVPPMSTQKRIMAHVKDITARIHASIAKTQRQIDLIREYRTRLIADVVTGKLDVRGAPLPDLDADDEPDTEEANG